MEKSQSGWRVYFQGLDKMVYVALISRHTVWRFQVRYISFHKAPECSGPRTDVVIHFRLRLAGAYQRRSHLGFLKLCGKGVVLEKY